MKRILIYLLPLLLLAGCAKDFSEDINSIGDKITELWTHGQGGSDDPIVFLQEVDYSAFVSLPTLYDRFSACSAPESLINDKTTRALGLSILHYPLNSLILAYNYYDSAVKTVYDNSPLHRALAARKDAAEALVGIFENTRIDKGAVLVAKDYEEITLVDELFLEYYLGSGFVKGLDSGSNKNRMKAAVTRKRDERLADPELNGALTLIPLAYLNERLGLGVQFSTDIVNTMHQFIEDN